MKKANNFANTHTAVHGSSKKGNRQRPMLNFKSDGFGTTKIEVIAGQFETVSFMMPRGSNSQRDDFSF